MTALHRGVLLRPTVILLTVLVGLLVVPPTAHAVEGDLISIRLAEAPTARADDPRAQVYIVDHVAPGSRFTRDVEVTNDTDRPRTIDVYPGPADIVDGAWTVADPGAESDLTGWLSTGRDQVSLAPGESAVVPVTVDVPDTATEGERYGVVWASTAGDGDGQVRMVSRVGIRVYLSVGPGGEPASHFDITALDGSRAEDGTLQAVATVTNTGGRAVDLGGALSLTDGPGGLRAGPFDVENRSTLAPGETGRVSLDLDPSLPLGPWHARLRLESGQATDSISATLTFPDRVGTTEGEQDTWPWWAWVAGALGALVLLGLLAWLLLRRRPPARRVEPRREVRTRTRAGTAEPAHRA